MMRPKHGQTILSGLQARSHRRVRRHAGRAVRRRPLVALLAALSMLGGLPIVDIGLQEAEAKAYRPVRHRGGPSVTRPRVEEILRGLFARGYDDITYFAVPAAARPPSLPPPRPSAPPGKVHPRPYPPEALSAVA